MHIKFTAFHFHHISADTLNLTAPPDQQLTLLTLLCFADDMIWACCLSGKTVSLRFLRFYCQVLCTISHLLSFQHLACQRAQSIANTPVRAYGWKISCKKLYTIMHRQKTFSSVKSFYFPVIKTVFQNHPRILIPLNKWASVARNSLILSICLILSPPRNNKKSFLRLRETGVKIKQDVKIYNP